LQGAPPGEPQEDGTFGRHNGKKGLRHVRYYSNVAGHESP
jgi:hypothetical protein